MQRFRPHRWLKDQRGISLVEQVMAALFIGFLILVWVNSIRVTTKGTVQSKNNLRAQNLALSKLEDIKNTALQASYSNTWRSVTQTVLVQSYGSTHVATIEGKQFTWRVLSDFAELTITAVPTPNAAPTPVSYSTNNLMLRAEVYWQDVTGPKQLTQTGFTTNLRQ